MNAPADISSVPHGTTPPHQGPPLRVALLGYRSAPYTGGQGVYLHYLSQALRARGHSVSVISGPPYPNLDDDIALHRLPSLDLYSNGLSSVSANTLWRDPLARTEWFSKLTGGFAEPWTFGERVKAWMLARADEFDVVHDNQTLSDGVLSLQEAGMPLVATIHHPITRDFRLALAAASGWSHRLLVRRWYRFLGMQGRVARALDNIVTVSGVSRRDICADFGVDPRRVQVMHNGVDTALFKPIPEISRNPDQLIATASADVPIKGLQVLLRAAAALAKRRPGLRLMLIGKPRPGGDTEKLVDSLGLAPRIQWLSGVDQARLVSLYAESAVAVVPSLYEGFGLPAVEAMACGIPLVSSDGGALGEVVGDGGVQVPAGDAVALERALDEMLSDPAAQLAWGTRARLRAETQFSWAICAERLEHYYRARLRRC